MITSHILGFPRIGAQRELKFALEAFWRDPQSDETLQQVCQDLRRRHWQWQQAAQLDYISVGDFAPYDHVLSTLALLGALPTRFNLSDSNPALAEILSCARGTPAQAAMEMTKWFDTNYHYLVPEWTVDTCFNVKAQGLVAEIRDAQRSGAKVKPVLLGPLSLLFLGKAKQGLNHPLTLLPALLNAYSQLLQTLRAEKCEWVQIDEPILTLALTEEWQQGFTTAYAQLAPLAPAILLTTYFGSVAHQLPWLQKLSVAGWHIDLQRAPEQLDAWLDCLSNAKPSDSGAAGQSMNSSQILSCGVIDGRNIWRCDQSQALSQLTKAQNRLGDRVWVAPSCSLLHVPMTLEPELKLKQVVGPRLAFALEKLGELQVLQQQMNQSPLSALDPTIYPGTVMPDVRRRVAALRPVDAQRHQDFAKRQVLQTAHLSLPLFPTTTIGSFPQTSAIRQARAAFKRGELSHYDYLLRMREEIAATITEQEALGLDVLVHGEAERNDMVEYFGEQLLGYAFSVNGWVQSYGSRCVKPPILYGDVARLEAMTVEWTCYAQSLTQKPVKGMLTGPVTLLQWSFVRNDLPRSSVALQLALAIRDEVTDLEKAGIAIIQIDEPAFREGLPLHPDDWPDYLDWAVQAFRVASSGVADRTQIHTHMCYSEFNDILPAIAALDADVITIETSRSDMELLEGFARFAYPNSIGPGVYDIHSPRLPSRASMQNLIDKARQVIADDKLWINPDCGLKTRDWPEVRAALKNMVAAAQALRQSALATTD